MRERRDRGGAGGHGCVLAVRAAVAAHRAIASDSVVDTTCGKGGGKR